MLGDMALVAFAAAIPFAVAGAYYDLKTMEIPHWVAPVAAVVFAAIVFVGLPMDAAINRILGGLFVLFVGFLLHMARAMGGGDVKLAAAFAILVAAGDAAEVLILLSICSLLNMAVIWGLRRTSLAEGEWRVWSDKGFPYAVALGQALLIYLALVAFLVG